NVTLGADVQIDLTASTLIEGGIISGAHSLTKAGAGTLTLSNANTFSGGVTLNSGILNINNSQALGTVAGRFTIAGGTIDNTSCGDITTLNYLMTWSGDFTYLGSVPRNLDLGTGAVTLSGANRQVTITAGTLAVGGIIGDGGNTYKLTKAGAGTLTLGGAN